MIPSLFNPQLPFTFVLVSTSTRIEEMKNCYEFSMAYEMTQTVDKLIVPDTNEHNTNLFVLHLMLCPMFRRAIASLGHLRPFSDLCQT